MIMYEGSGMYVYMNPPLDPILSQKNPVHTYVYTPYFLKIHRSTTLPFMPRSPKWSGHFTFSKQNNNKKRPACFSYLPRAY
jgi:hypothetical protein